MNTFKIIIHLENEAFDGLNREYEICRILKQMSKQVQEGKTQGQFGDSNGNTCGYFHYDTTGATTKRSWGSEPVYQRIEEDGIVRAELRK